MIWLRRWTGWWSGAGGTESSSPGFSRGWLGGRLGIVSAALQPGVPFDGCRAAGTLSLAFALLAAVSALPMSAAHAQKQQDPLSEAQVDQVRELGDRPNDRIKLYLKFVEERVSAIRELSVDSHENSRPADLRSKLEEFTRLTDELADNIDSYTTAKADVRKALKAVLEASAKWPDVLRKPPPDPAYEFVRKTALDAAISSNDDAKKLLAEQETYFAAHKDEAGKNGKAPSMPDPKQ